MVIAGISRVGAKVGSARSPEPGPAVYENYPIKDTDFD